MRVKTIVNAAVIWLAVLSFYLLSCGGDDPKADITPEDGGNTAGDSCKTDRDCPIGTNCEDGKCVEPSTGFDDDDDTSGDDDDSGETLCPPSCDLPNATSECKNPFDGCVIVSCNEGFHDLNEDPSDGCEYECAPSEDGIEYCDGLDNNCNGEIDETDIDNPLTRESWVPSGIQTDLENCGRCGERCYGGPNSTPRCVSAVCKIECDAGHVIVDPNDPMQGCKKAASCSPTNGGIEICDGLDNDCNGIIDEQVRDDGTRICPVGHECRDGEDGRKCYKKNTGGCTPDCAGKRCGDDGCGGVCGYCQEDEVCNSEYKCEYVEQCYRDCEGKKCGPDGCGGDCGVCAGYDQCVGGQCVGSFSSQNLQMNMTYTASVLEKRRAFLVFRSGDGNDPLCSETGVNKGGENEVYPDAEKEPNWADQGFPKYTYLGGAQDKIDYKTTSNGDGEY